MNDNVIIALYNRTADKNYHNPGILKKNDMSAE
jgi:hypothetical protein